jgi:hypothetical protein
MNYRDPIVNINIENYDNIVSIGNKCPTTIILRKLNLYKESFPFDYIPTTPKLILKYLKNTTDFYPKKNVVITDDNVWFGHFNINEKYDETIKTFERRFDRLFKILQTQKRILFIYTSEADVYNENGNRYNDNYNELCNIQNYIRKTYKYNNFTILAIHTNKSYENTDNIINYTIQVPEKYLSDDKSTHIEPIYTEYRRVLCDLIKKIFKK